jgi:hypothetical protein
MNTTNGDADQAKIDEPSKASNLQPPSNEPVCSNSGPLKRAEFVRNIYAHILPAGMDWRCALRPDYWLPELRRLTAGCRIEVCSFDARIQFEIIVFAVSERVKPVLLDMAFRAIWPPNLDLPAPIFRESNYRIEQGAIDWKLLDRHGKEIGSYLDRATAGDAMALLEREALAEAALLEQQKERIATRAAA